MVEITGDLARWIPERYATFTGVETLTCTPVSAGGRWLGVIFADRGGERFQISDAERHAMWTLGKTAALAASVRIATGQHGRARLLQARIELARLDPRAGGSASLRSVPRAGWRHAERRVASAAPMRCRPRCMTFVRPAKPLSFPASYRATLRGELPGWGAIQGPPAGAQLGGRHRGASQRERWPSRCWPRRCATPTSTPSRPACVCTWTAPTERSCLK